MKAKKKQISVLHHGDNVVGVMMPTNFTFLENKKGGINCCPHNGITKDGIDKQIKVIHECYQDANFYDFDILATSLLRMDCGLFNCHFCCSGATEKSTEDFAEIKLFLIKFPDKPNFLMCYVKKETEQTLKELLNHVLRWAQLILSLLYCRTRTERSFLDNFFVSWRSQRQHAMPH